MRGLNVDESKKVYPRQRGLKREGGRGSRGVGPIWDWTGGEAGGAGEAWLAHGARWLTWWLTWVVHEELGRGWLLGLFGRRMQTGVGEFRKGLTAWPRWKADA